MSGLLDALKRDGLADERVLHVGRERLDDGAGATLGVVDLLPERYALEARVLLGGEVGPGQRRRVEVDVAVDELPAEQFLVGF